MKYSILFVLATMTFKMNARPRDWTWEVGENGCVDLSGSWQLKGCTDFNPEQENLANLVLNVVAWGHEVARHRTLTLIEQDGCESLKMTGTGSFNSDSTSRYSKSMSQAIASVRRGVRSFHYTWNQDQLKVLRVYREKGYFDSSFGVPLWVPASHDEEETIFTLNSKGHIQVEIRKQVFRPKRERMLKTRKCTLVPEYEFEW